MICESKESEKSIIFNKIYRNKKRNIKEIRRNNYLRAISTKRTFSKKNRKKVIDLSFIYELVKDLYSPRGKESIDPVVLIKLNIIQYTFGIRSMRQTLKKSVRHYEEELQIEITKDREKHNKNAFKKNKQNSIEKGIKTSTTDKECGVFHKGEHKKVFAYTVNLACDRNNYIMGFETAAGNCQDSNVFYKIYEKI